MKHFKRILAVRLAKLAAILIRFFHLGNGAVFPGRLAQIIDPEILPALSSQVREKIIAVMGTNGKTTTNSILYHALKREGKKVISNRTGANMPDGIVSAFVLAADWHGKLDTDYACMEVDENASLYVLPRLCPHCVILTNISRDQLDRFGEIDLTWERIRTALSKIPDARLVINCDDVLSASLMAACPNPAVTYGINEPIFDRCSRSGIRESIFCRRCGKKLTYKFFHYGQLGIYHCPGCGQKRPEPDYTVSHVTVLEGIYSFALGSRRPPCKVQAPYNIYNTLAAYAALSTLDVPRTHFEKAMANFDYGNHRERTFFIHGTRVQLHLAKNPVSFQQKLSLIQKDPRPKDLIIQIHDNAPDGKDVSYLWDVDFQYLRDCNCSTITTVGSRRHDMELRLKYEDIPCQASKDLRKLIKGLARNGTGNLYILVNYSGLYQVNRLLQKIAIP